VTAVFLRIKNQENFLKEEGSSKISRHQKRLRVACSIEKRGIYRESVVEVRMRKFEDFIKTEGFCGTSEYKKKKLEV